MPIDTTSIARWVQQPVASTPVYDLHTHLYPASFSRLSLWGIEELITYHYLIAESIRATGLSYEKYWAMPQARQTEFIWKTLFIDRAPISEACRGVVTVLKRLGLDVASKNLSTLRQFFAS